MKEFTLRMATPADSDAILHIYAPYVRESSATFEEAVPSPEEFRQRVEGILAFYPYLVCEREGQIVGYAYAHQYKERAAYRWNAELSIYLKPECTGKGIGKALYAALEEILRLQGYVQLCGVVTLPNPGSEALHKAMGYELVGRYPNSGYKNGQWLDVGWFVKNIAPFTVPPQEPRSVHTLDAAQIAQILSDF